MQMFLFVMQIMCKVQKRQFSAWCMMDNTMVERARWSYAWLRCVHILVWVFLFTWASRVSQLFSFVYSLSPSTSFLYYIPLWTITTIILLIFSSLLIYSSSFFFKSCAIFSFSLLLISSHHLSFYSYFLSHGSLSSLYFQNISACFL